MNSHAEAKSLAAAAEVAASGGHEGARLVALRGLRLRTVIKESHCSPIAALAFNTTDGGRHCNLFATVGSDQVTVYDDQHLAEHVATVAALSLSGTSDTGRGADAAGAGAAAAAAAEVLHAAAWVSSQGLSRHPFGDALLAVGGSGGRVLLLSVAEAAVVSELPLPRGAAAVAELAGAADAPGLLLVTTRDGALALWHVGTGQCLIETHADVVAAVRHPIVALHPSGNTIVTSGRGGKLRSWDLRPLLAAAGCDSTGAALGSSRPGGSSYRGSCGSRERSNNSGGHPPLAPAPTAVLEAAAAALSCEHLESPVSLHGSAVDCLRFLDGERLAVKAVDGRMAVLHLPSRQTICSWRVPGCGGATLSVSNRCAFGHTADGRYVCAGNHSAAAFVFDTHSGAQLARVEAIRVSGSVRAVGLSDDCRHLLLVAGSGYVFRFEHRPPPLEREPPTMLPASAGLMFYQENAEPEQEGQEHEQQQQQQQQQQQEMQQQQQQQQQACDVTQLPVQVLNDEGRQTAVTTPLAAACSSPGIAATPVLVSFPAAAAAAAVAATGAGLLLQANQPGCMGMGNGVCTPMDMLATPGSEPSAKEASSQRKRARPSDAAAAATPQAASTVAALPLLFQRTPPQP